MFTIKIFLGSGEVFTQDAPVDTFAEVQRYACHKVSKETGVNKVQLFDVIDSVYYVCEKGSERILAVVIITRTH